MNGWAKDVPAILVSQYQVASSFLDSVHKDVGNAQIDISRMIPLLSVLRTDRQKIDDIIKALEEEDHRIGNG